MQLVRIHILILLCLISSCSTTSVPAYKAWSRYFNKNFAYLMYSRPRTINDTSTEIQNGKYLHKVNLVNMKGKIIYSWNAGCPVAHAELYANFEIAVACFIELADRTQFPPGSFERIRHLNKKSELLFEYTNVNMHHTFFKKGSSFFTLQNRRLSTEEKKKFKLNFDSKIDGWVDNVIQVDHDGKELWAWDISSDGKFDFSKSLTTDLSHANSVAFYEKSVLSKNPVVVISYRNIDTVVIVDYVTKKILWNSGSKMFSRQHDASLIDGKTLLLFDNDVVSNDSKSKVVTIDLENNSKKIIYEQSYFAVSKMGAVQKTDEDRYLITDSLLGYAFEVNSNKDLISNIWNTNINKNENAINQITDFEAIIFSPIFKVKLYSLDKL